MAHKKYDYIRLEPAKNGYILHYEKYEKPSGSESGFANCCPVTVSEVYTNDQLAEAMAKLKMLNEENE